MNDLGQLGTVGSALMYASTGLALVTLLWAIVQAVLEARGKVFGRYWWLAGPVGIIVCGIVGIGCTMGEVAGRTMELPAADRQQFVAHGLSLAMNQWALLGICLAVTGVVGSICIGVSTYVRGDGDESRMQRLGAGLMLSGLAWVWLVVGLGSQFWNTAPVDYFAVFGLLLASPGLGLVMRSQRGPNGRDRRAATVLVAGFFLVATVAGGFISTLGLGAIEIFKALEGVEAANRHSFVAEQWAGMSHVWLLSGGPLLWSVGAAATGLGIVCRREDEKDVSSVGGLLAGILVPIAVSLLFVGWFYGEFSSLVVDAM